MGIKSDYRSKQKIEVLFIGNSYTYYNQMPDMVSALSKVNKNSKYYIAADSVTAGGATLEMHWKNRNALNAIKKKKWDYIVIQGQSLTMMFPQTRRSFDRYLNKFVSEIRTHSPNTRIVLFSTWQRENGDPIYTQMGFDYSSMLDTVQKNYYYYANHYNLDVVYTGSYFYGANKLGIDTYHDGSHPNVLGSYIVAKLFYKKFIPDAKVSCDDINYIYGISKESCHQVARLF